MASRQWVVRSSKDLGRTIADLRHQRSLSQGHSRSRLVSTHVPGEARGGAVSTIFFDRALRLLRRLGASLIVQIDDAPRSGEPDGTPT